MNRIWLQLSVYPLFLSFDGFGDIYIEWQKFVFLLQIPEFHSKQSYY